jgi:hypothetical protein
MSPDPRPRQLVLIRARRAAAVRIDRTDGGTTVTLTSEPVPSGGART